MIHRFGFVVPSESVPESLSPFQGQITRTGIPQAVDEPLALPPSGAGIITLALLEVHPREALDQLQQLGPVVAVGVAAALHLSAVQEPRDEFRHGDLGYWRGLIA